MKKNLFSKIRFKSDRINQLRKFPRAKSLIRYKIRKNQFKTKLCILIVMMSSRYFQSTYAMKLLMKSKNKVSSNILVEQSPINQAITNYSNLDKKGPA